MIGAGGDIESVWSEIIRSLRSRWAGYPVIVALLLIGLIVNNFLPARERFFTERDGDLAYPYKSNTIPTWSLVFIGGLAPAAIIIATQVLIRRYPNGVHYDRQTRDVHMSVLVLLEVVAVTWVMTTILKCFVGRLRPNFYAYCDYKGYRSAVNAGNLTDYLANTTPGEIGNFTYCLDDQLDAHFSFPSGHSSVSFCGLTFLSLFLLRVTSCVNFTHHNVGKTIRFFIVLIPLFSAGLVAASRVVDYMHHVEDTVWGALIGILGAFLAFNSNYGYPRPSSSGGGGVNVSPHAAKSVLAGTYGTNEHSVEAQAKLDVSVPLVSPKTYH